MGVAIPHSGLLSQVSSLRLPLGPFRPGPYAKECSPHLPVQPLLASGKCGHLPCFSAGSYRWAHNLWVLIIYLFFLPVLLPSEVPRLTTDLAVRVFPGVWKPLFFKTPFPGWISIPTSFVSLFIFYIFSYLLLKTMDCLSGCLHSEVVLWNLLSIQMFFRCICGGESGLPVLVLHHLRTAS